MGAVARWKICTLMCQGNLKSVFAQDYRVLTPPSTLIVIVCFRDPPFPFPKGTFVLATTHPLPLNFFTCEIQRKNINSESQYLWLNLTCLLRSHNEISGKQTPLIHDKSVCFIEILSQNQKSSKVNMKSSICHDFPSLDLLEGSKGEKIKENQNFFSF